MLSGLRPDTLMKPMDSLGPDFLSAVMKALTEGKPKCKHEAQRLQLSQSAAYRSFWGGGGVGIKIAIHVFGALHDAFQSYGRLHRRASTYVSTWDLGLGIFQSDLS